MFVNSDFSDLLRLFNVNQVRYLVIGGYALIQYAEPRYTKDLDVWISADATNAQAVYRALREFGAPLAGLTAADFAQEGYFYQAALVSVENANLETITLSTHPQFIALIERSRVRQRLELRIAPPGLLRRYHLGLLRNGRATMRLGLTNTFFKIYPIDFSPVQ